MQPDEIERRMTRRQALKTAGAPFLILPAGLARGYAANEKLNIGVIGLTGMGAIDASTLNKLGENVAALCDVDAAMLARRGAEYPKAARYTDFRKMIEREKLDGVVVATPDHTHTYLLVRRREAAARGYRRRDAGTGTRGAGARRRRWHLDRHEGQPAGGARTLSRKADGPVPDAAREGLGP